MVELANRFASRGHRVDLVLVQAEGKYLDEVDHRVKIVNLDRSRVLWSVGPFASYLNKEQPDAVLSALTHVNLAAIISRILARIKTVLVVSERNSLVRLKGKSGRLFRALMRRLYPLADRVVTVSQGIAQELQDEIGLSKELVTAIPNPVDLQKIRHLASSSPMHPWLADSGPPLLIAVGRLEEQKDYPTLLAALAQVRTTHDVRLIILGEGSLRSELECLIEVKGLSSAVDLVGFQANPFGWIAASDVYVLSSKYEGFPNSLLQSLACGLRVISTDCPTGPAEILEGGKWGRLVPIGDPHEMAKAIIETVNQKSWPAVSRKVDEFKIDHVVCEYEKALRLS